MLEDEEDMFTVLPGENQGCIFQCKLHPSLLKSVPWYRPVQKMEPRGAAFCVPILDSNNPTNH